MWEPLENMGMTATGLLMALLCSYVLFGRLLGMYVFDTTGANGVRKRLMVQVVVLGDIGCSPRMRYHATSLADSGCTVDLIGYAETNPGARINVNRYIRVRRIRQAWSVPEGSPKVCYLLWAPFKAIFLSLQLFWLMGCISQRPDFIIVQNPPSIPTLMIARIVGVIRKAWVIIDWHNFGYSILGMKLGMDHKVVRLAKWYEQKYGQKAYAHLTVTDKMHAELKDNWKVNGKILTLKDKPQSDFKRLTVDQIHRQFTFSLGVIQKTVLESPNGKEFLGKFNNPKLGTLLTDADDEGFLMWREDRPKLIVSSTSWTEDEDFSVLLKAIELYEAQAKPSDPRLLFVITGKGPQKKFYEEKIKQMTLVKTRIITAWLETADYPMLLGSADLGVSLHTSSSGMDLPMKIVDMFGCGLPVCAIQFSW
ncbi:glycosyl transferases group 1-domain-containing protein [Mucor mucedo]|uniref:glycosyl transferases group 1-domain-containing protein n=1 Tax=Mucor mucedo TaxID=29922 RepID=UPI00221EADC2|nr:glycosyl transferases group 1-domain-containing protein [Mucor mucedo]KAI7889811.1 glycosyl transferases group 1-domain-containing protein [Mucor mucedo]